MTEAQKTYLDTLTLYYEEEIEGEAYFAELATIFERPDHRDKMRLLADVERHAADAVAPLIEKYDLLPKAPDALRARGIEEARSTNADWANLMTDMTTTYPGYLDDFKALEAMGPAEDQARLSFLTEHEIAALAFLEIEARDPDQSAEPLQAYLAMSVESWQSSMEETRCAS